MNIREKLNETDNNYPIINWEEIVKKDPKLKATFVIPTYNASKTIKLVLEGIENQNLIKNIKEVIIVDNSENLETKKEIFNYKNRSKLEIIYIKNPENKHTAYSRNRGIEYTTGDVICFLDADIIIPPDYLNYHLNLHENISKVVTLSFRTNISIENSIYKKLEFPVKEFVKEHRLEATVKKERCKSPEELKYAGQKLKLFEQTHEFREFGNGKKMFWDLPDMCITCAICYKADILKRVKGAPENFVQYGCEDTAMAVKVIANDYKVIPILRAGVYHIEHERIYGEDFIRGFEKNLKRLELLKDMRLEDTYEYNIKELEGI